MHILGSIHNCHRFAIDKIVCDFLKNILTTLLLFDIFFGLTLSLSPQNLFLWMKYTCTYNCFGKDQLHQVCIVFKSFPRNITVLLSITYSLHPYHRVVVHLVCYDSFLLNWLQANQEASLSYCSLIHCPHSMNHWKIHKHWAFESQ